MLELHSCCDIHTTPYYFIVVLGGGAVTWCSLLFNDICCGWWKYNHTARKRQRKRNYFANFSRSTQGFCLHLCLHKPSISIQFPVECLVFTITAVSPQEPSGNLYVPSLMTCHKNVCGERLVCRLLPLAYPCYANCVAKQFERCRNKVRPMLWTNRNEVISGACCWEQTQELQSQTKLYCFILLLCFMLR